METDGGQAGVLEFAGFRLDGPRRRLSRGDGTPVVISSRAFDTLQVLVARPGTVISKQALLDAVWPGVIVEENNLTQAVSALRKALGDHDDPPQIIRTVPGRGYCLVATVTAGADFPPAPAERTPATAPAAPGGGDPSRATRIFGRRAAWTAAALALIGLTTGLVSWLKTPVDLPGTLAVLPLDMLEPAAGAELFVSGLHEELLTQLGRVRGLRVLARGAVASYRSGGQPVGTVARKLGATSVLEGSVRVAGPHLRIALRLTDARTQLTLWSASYDASLDELERWFAVQADIAGNVARALSVDRRGEKSALAREVPTRSPQAYQHYLRAVTALHANDFRTVFDQLEATVAIDPDFTEAWHRLADVNLILTATPVTSAADQRQRALAAARRAVALDPDSARTHSLLGAIRYEQWDFEGATREFAAAAQRRADDPGDEYSQYRTNEAVMDLALGRPEVALAKLDELLQSNPIHLVAMSLTMLAHEYLGDHATAMRIHDRASTQLPTWWGRNPRLWIALGRSDDGEWLRTARRGFHDFLPQELLQQVDDPAAMRATLTRLHTQRDKLVPAVKFNAAMFAARLGQTAQALDFLRDGLRENGTSTYLVWLPVFADLRQTPGFRALLREAGLVGYWNAHGWPAACTRQGAGPDPDFRCR